jgi:ribosome biogenesis protein Nip4
LSLYKSNVWAQNHGAKLFLFATNGKKYIYGGCL